jgi:aldehyde:ferredoxin oxidoreductase
MQDPLPSGPAENMVIEPMDLERMKEAYYQFRSWDPSNGYPTPQKLIELGLEDLVPEIWG